MTNPTPSMANQPSLTDNVAGTLAYLTIIPAIALLFLEPYRRNRLVRFHAWQCILLTAAWCTAEALLFIAAYTLPLLDFMIGALDSLFTLGVVIVWIVLLIKAMNGERYKLPILGNLAEKQAGI
ncbi:MAG TPA: hypothetical protein VN151_10380 [Terracidiphilus sp.]|nr:hypothetical protein [Terracidiphilus sp.]